MIKLAKACLGIEELEGVKKVFDKAWLGMGDMTFSFEEALKKYLHSKNVIAVNTGTSALHLALHAVGIGPGDEVIVPSLTYVASFQAVAMTGAKPVPCECHPDTLLIDLDDAEKRITEKTKAIMPVHYCGQPADLSRLLSWKSKYGVRIVEDAAHALGSSYQSKMIGGQADLTCFSFDSIKNITSGEGGAVCTTDDRAAAKLKDLRLLGVDRESEFRYNNQRKWQYDVPSLGFRYHMSNINAAIGLAQLAKIDIFIKRRREICLKYNRSFKRLDWLEPLKINYRDTAPFMYIVKVLNGKREELMNYLKEKEIETGIHYIPNHWHSFFKSDSVKLPVSDSLGEQILTLPLHSGLTDSEVDIVITAVSEF